MNSGMTWARLALLGALLLSKPCWAQSVADKAAAEALFDEGVRLLDAGQYEAACKKLEDSQRVDPGIGTLLYLADCYEKSGRTASAWATFREAASLARNAGQMERAEIGMQRADRLEAKLSRLAIEVAEETRALDGLSVRRGPEELSPAVFGAAIPVDPGKHRVVASAPGYLPYQTEVEVASNGESVEVSIPALLPDPNAQKEAKAAEPEPEPARSEVAPLPPAPPPPPPGKAQRMTGLILGGVGLVGFGVGGVFGLMAIDRNNEAFSSSGGNCGDVECPPGPGNDLINEAYDLATVSTIAFIAGGAFAATGAVLYLTAPKGMEPQVTKLQVQPIPGGSAVLLGGTF
jgi:serine/threonine-protein kinase